LSAVSQSLASNPRFAPVSVFAFAFFAIELSLSASGWNRVRARPAGDAFGPIMVPDPQGWREQVRTGQTRPLDSTADVSFAPARRGLPARRSVV
jgi:hypothetical protein